MKKRIYTLVFLMLISVVAIHSFAQERTDKIRVNSKSDIITEQKSDSAHSQYNDSVKSCDYRILSVSLTSSWYRPELDFFNGVFLPASKVSDRFGWNYAIGGNITFSLPKEFRSRLGFSYWKDEVLGNESSALTSLQIALVRYKLGLLYAPSKISFGRFQPYLGVDGQFFMVRNKLAIEPNLPIQKGSDYAFAPLVGLEYVNKHFVSSLEYSYNFGNYMQDICDCMGLSRQNVSIDGPEISFSIGYKF